MALVGILAVGGADAAETRSFRLDSVEAYATGEIEGLEVSATGEATLAASARSVWGPEPGVLWSLALLRGKVHVGLSDPARVVRVDDDSAAELFRGGTDEWVTAIAEGPRGTLLVGVSPTGRVLALDGGRVVRDESVGGGYVWALARDEDGTVWAGLGNPGRIARRDGAEAWTVVHETGDDPVRSLAPLPGGGIVAGTGREGRVLAIARDGRPFARLDADEEEIVALAVAPQGDVWALAARSGRARPPAPAEARSEAEAAAENGEGAEPDAEPSSVQGTTMSVRAGNGGASVRVSAPAGPAGGTLYRLRADGEAEAVWESPKAPPYALGIGPDGRPWIGLGGDGRIVRVGPDGTHDLVARIPSETPTAIAAGPDGQVWIGASGDARVIRLGSAPAERGTYASEPIDAGSVADWGTIHWRATVPPDGSIAVETRTGNVADPDGTWSPWVRAGLADGTGSADAGVPAARWGQVRVTVTGGKAGQPAVHEFEWVYRPRNRPPRIAAFDVERPGVAWGRAGGGSTERTRPLVADDPVARRVADEVGRRSRPAPIRKSYEPGVRTVRWIAVDPDGDALRFDLEWKRVGDDRWTPLASGIEDDFFGWDARGLPDGRYRLRLTADDGIDNATERTRRTSRVSEPFAVDGTAPRVESRVADDAWTVRVRDPGGRVAALEFAADGEDWELLDPIDGVADSEDETYRIPRSRARDGVEPRVRATDVSGNVRWSSLSGPG